MNIQNQENYLLKIVSVKIKAPLDFKKQMNQTPCGNKTVRGSKRIYQNNQFMFQMHPNQQKTCVVCRKKMTEFELYKHIKNIECGKLFKEKKINRLIDQKYQYMINDCFF